MNPYTNINSIMLMSLAHKFKEGEIVFDRMRPNQKLVVNKIVGNVYYCHVYENPQRASLVYFEKDLRGNTHNSNEI